MGFLFDVKRTHVFWNRGRTRTSTHVMHPFTNTVGSHRDLYEVLRSLSTKKKQSAHVSYPELVELYAHGCFAEFNIRLRMKAYGSVYPTSPPALHPHENDILHESDFARAVGLIDTRAAMSTSVKKVLRQLGVSLEPAVRGQFAV